MDLRNSHCNTELQWRSISEWQLYSRLPTHQDWGRKEKGSKRENKGVHLTNSYHDSSRKHLRIWWRHIFLYQRKKAITDLRGVRVNNIRQTNQNIKLEYKPNQWHDFEQLMNYKDNQSYIDIKYFIFWVPSASWLWKEWENNPSSVNNCSLLCSTFKINLLTSLNVLILITKQNINVINPVKYKRKGRNRSEGIEETRWRNEYRSYPYLT